MSVLTIENGRTVARSEYRAAVESCMRQGLIRTIAIEGKSPTEFDVAILDKDPQERTSDEVKALKRMCMARLRAERRGQDTSQFPDRVRRPKERRSNANED